MGEGAALHALGCSGVALEVRLYGLSLHAMRQIDHLIRLRL